LLSFAEEHELPCFRSIDDFAGSDIPRPDFLAVFSLHKILTADETALPKIAALNLHPSLLPLYKGPNPWQEQFKDRVEVSGFTVHKITPDIDGGEIISQQAFKMDYSLPGDAIMDNSLKDIGGPLLADTIINYGEIIGDKEKVKYRSR
jgi:methionyl-tRNA formyltransferase